MIKVIDATLMGWPFVKKRLVVDTSVPTTAASPVVHRFSNSADFRNWGWRYIPRWDGKATNNIIYKVLIIIK